MSNDGYQGSARRTPAAGWVFIAILLSLLVPGRRVAFGESSGVGNRTAVGPVERARLHWNTGNGLNDGRLLGGTFEIGGAPNGYETGKTYPMTVTIAHPGKTRWGFQLSARFADSGDQAGSWSAVDESTRVQEDGGIQYVTEAAGGAQDETRDGPVQFRVNWTAPPAPEGLVIFSAAGNAAAAVDSPEDDFIYSAGSFSRPAEFRQAAAPARPAGAPQQPEQEPVDVTPTTLSVPARLQETSRVASLPSPVDLKRGSLEILIQHRFLQSISSAGAGNAFGVDSGANIDLGVNYALTDRLSVGVARSRFDQIVDLSSTVEIRTAGESRWKLSFVGGVEGKRNFHDVYSPYLQLSGSVDFGPVRVNAVPTASFNTRPEDRLQFDLPRAINPGSNSTFSLGLGTDIALNRRLSLMAEYVPRLAGFGGFDERRDHVAGGFVIRTWGHVFTILVGRSREFTPSKYGVNAEDSDVSLGFNLYRRIR